MHNFPLNILVNRRYTRSFVGPSQDKIQRQLEKEDKVNYSTLILTNIRQHILYII